MAAALIPSRALVLNGPPGTNTDVLATALSLKYDAVVLSTMAATLARVPRIIVPDLGFFAELDALVACFGGSHVMMVHVVRDGCTYDHDPRNYVDHPAVDAITVTYTEETVMFTVSLIAYLFFELPIV